MGNPYGQPPSYQMNANGGTDEVFNGQVVRTINPDGSVTFPGNVTDNLALAIAGILTDSYGIGGRFAVTVQSMAGDGAIAVPSLAQGIAYVRLSKGSAAAITLADAGPADVGKMIIVSSSSAFAHVITAATSGFNAKGSSGTATLVTPFVNAGLILLAVAAANWATVCGGMISTAVQGWQIA